MMRGRAADRPTRPCPHRRPPLDLVRLGVAHRATPSRPPPHALVDRRPRGGRPGDRRRRRRRRAAPRASRTSASASSGWAACVASRRCGSWACTLRVAHELERTADLMVNVARTTWRLLSELGSTPPCPACSTASAARPRADPGGGERVRRPRPRRRPPRSPTWTTPSTSMHDALLRHALDTVRRRDRSTTRRAQRAVQLALVARHYERAGDHAVTIAGFVPFVVDRRAAEQRRYRGTRT